VKRADDLVLLAKEETMLQGMIDRRIEIGRCCGLEMNVERNKGYKNVKGIIPITQYDKSERTREYGIF
jgi:hypothetical protein